MDLTYPQGATPLDPDEAAGLLPQHITTQADLNAWEETNILEGEKWATRQTKRDLLTEGFVRDLHSKMFSHTWRWAGTFRASNKNIGTDWPHIATRLRNLLDNTRYPIDHTPSQATRKSATHWPSAFITSWCGSTPFPTATAATPACWPTP